MACLACTIGFQHIVLTDYISRGWKYKTDMDKSNLVGPLKSRHLRFFLSKRPFSLSTLYVCFCVNIILFISSNLSWKFPSLRVCKFLARRKTGNACNFTCKVLLYRLIRGSFAPQMTVNESSILNFSIFLRIHGYTHVFRIKIKVPFLYIMRI